MHVNDRDSAEASAEGLKRELEIGLGFYCWIKENWKFNSEILGYYLCST